MMRRVGRSSRSTSIACLTPWGKLGFQSGVEEQAGRLGEVVSNFTLNLSDEPLEEGLVEEPARVVVNSFRLHLS